MARYSMDYENEATDADEGDRQRTPYNHPRQNSHGEIRFRIPSIFKTAAVFLTGAAMLFSWETYAPEGYRISTFMGTYDARIAAAVKAAELQQQSGFEAYVADVKLAAAQQEEQYKALTQGFLQNYTANYEIAKLTTQAALDYQGRYASAIMNQKMQEQSTDVGIINLTRGFGRIMNALQPGAGDDALGYADNLSGTLADEVTAAARKGTGTPITDWQKQIPSPAEVAATLATIKPLQLPPLPSIGEARPVIARAYASAH